MTVLAIGNVDDPRLDPYRTVRERDLVGREGLFVAEGEVVLRTLLSRSRFALRSVLLSDRQAQRLSGTVLDLDPNLPVYVVPHALMGAIAGFPIHRGILALGCRGPDPTARELLATCSETSLVVGLVGLANHDNVGGIFRNAAAFGAAGVLLDDTSCDPLYRKAIRVSVGACLTVPFARAGSAVDLVEALLAVGFDVVALSPGGASRLSDGGWSARTALLLGAEGSGLPRAVLDRVRAAAIPMAPGFDSLNVATAAGIALYEAHRGMGLATRKGLPNEEGLPRGAALPFSSAVDRP